MEMSGNKNGKYAMSWRVSRPTKSDDSTHGVGRGRCGDHLAATLLKNEGVGLRGLASSTFR